MCAGPSNPTRAQEHPVQAWEYGPGVSARRPQIARLRDEAHLGFRAGAHRHISASQRPGPSDAGVECPKRRASGGTARYTTGTKARMGRFTRPQAYAGRVFFIGRIACVASVGPPGLSSSCWRMCQMASARGISPTGACGATPRGARRLAHAPARPLTAPSIPVRPILSGAAFRSTTRRPIGVWRGARYAGRVARAGHEEYGFIVHRQSLASGQRSW
jgi:hypothetical protein